jgi:hypothetical protein
LHFKRQGGIPNSLNLEKFFRLIVLPTGAAFNCPAKEHSGTFEVRPKTFSSAECGVGREVADIRFAIIARRTLSHDVHHE